MDFFNRHNFFRGTITFCLLILSFADSPMAVASDTINSQISALEKRFRSVSTAIYSDFVRQKKFGNKRFKTVNDLEQEVLDLVSKKKSIQAIYYIRKNLKLIEENIDSRAIFYLVDQLLLHNEWNTASKILQIVKDEGDKSLVSNVTFLFAKYYANRKHWPATLRNLAGVINDLPTEDAHYALLLQGISEQNRKNHRKAVKYYNRVPANSPYYAISMLNIAVAYIRQGWWTDAKLMIEKVVKNPGSKTNDEIINRMHLVNGYSLLKEGYFRNSRESFRNITVDSQYANRALLGIALTATNQEDFIGALNAINILKQKKSLDLSVDEAHLMLPYIYEKLKQPLTASSSYTAALTYYQQRIAAVNKLIETQIKASQNITISPDKSKLSIGNTEVVFTRFYPKSFLQNHTELVNLKSHTNSLSPGVKKKYNKLYNDHLAMLKLMAESLLRERIKHLNSYMSQSRFGLARLYDNSAVPTK